jgi:hypothetical protein
MALSLIKYQHWAFRSETDAKERYSETLWR